MNAELLIQLNTALGAQISTYHQLVSRRTLAVKPALVAQASWSAAQSAALHQPTNAAALMETPTTKAELRSALQNLADVRTFQPEADAMPQGHETVWKRKSQSS